MRLRSLPFCLGLVSTLSCMSLPSEPEVDPRETLTRIEDSLLYGPDLLAEIEIDGSRGGLSFIQGDGSSVEFSARKHVVSKGIAYWVSDDGERAWNLAPARGERVYGPVPPSQRVSAGPRPPGWMFIDILRPWGLSTDLPTSCLQGAHILSSTLTTAYLADVQAGRDAEGPFLACTFRIQEICHPLAEEYWNRSFFGGATMGPDRPLTGTAVHRIWYDPVAFTLKKREVSGEFSLDGDRSRKLAPVRESYSIRKGIPVTGIR